MFYILANMFQRNSNVQGRALFGRHVFDKKVLSITSSLFGGNDMMISVDLAEDINKYLSSLTFKFQLRPDFLHGHPGRVDGRMRAILVDWLMHMQRRFDLIPETLSLCISLLDRSLVAMSNITKHNLQLLGVTCLFIASKFEEVVVNNIEDFVHVCADAFTKNDVLRALDYNCSIPHTIQFLRRYRYYVSAPKEIYSLAKFICDVAHLTYVLAHHKPSTIAATAIYLSCLILNYTIKPEFYQLVVNLPEQVLIAVAREFTPYVIEMAQPNHKLSAVRDKHVKEAPINFSVEKISLLKNFARY